MEHGSRVFIATIEVGQYSYRGAGLTPAEAVDALGERVQKVIRDWSEESTWRSPSDDPFTPQQALEHYGVTLFSVRIGIGEFEDTDDTVGSLEIRSYWGANRLGVSREG